jgi:hypothetical protein
MTYNERDGFTAKVRAGDFSSLKGYYSQRGYDVACDGEWCYVKADSETFSREVPQFMHSYVDKMFGTIPRIHLVKPFAGGARYSQLAITYMLSYCFGMLARYFPTHWIALLRGSKGDSLRPTINAGQEYIDVSFPELIIEFIQDTLDQKRKAGA